MNARRVGLYGDRLLRYISEHEGCTVSELVNGLSIDAAEVWDRLTYNHQRGRITMKQGPSTLWRFYSREAVTR